MVTTSGFHRSRRAAAVVSTMTAAAALAVPAAHAAGGSSWTPVSTANVANTSETPSIAKFGSAYEAVWVAKVGAK